MKYSLKGRYNIDDKTHPFVGILNERDKQLKGSIMYEKFTGRKSIVDGTMEIDGNESIISLKCFSKLAYAPNFMLLKRSIGSSENPDLTGRYMGLWTYRESRINRFLERNELGSNMNSIYFILEQF